MWIHQLREVHRQMSLTIFSELLFWRETRRRNVALFCSPINRAFNYSLMECRLINPAIVSYQVREWSCQGTSRRQSSTFCVSGRKFDGVLVSTPVGSSSDVITIVASVDSNVFSFFRC